MLSISLILISLPLILTKELDFLTELGAHGQSYFPSDSKFNYLLDTNDTFDDNRAKNLTALAIRQQYMIGQELRRRYITDPSIGTGIANHSQFLNFSYNIQEIYTRTSGNSQSFISANAQLIGLYPPETCNQRLTQWQRENVRPPVLEGKLVEDIGEFATKGGFTPFDIFNQYPSEDELNEYNGESCLRYRELREQVYQSQEFQQIKTNLSQQVLPQIQQITGTNVTAFEDVTELCQFIDDAFQDGYDFKTFNYTQQLEDLCKMYLLSQSYYKLHGHKNLTLLKISEFSQLLSARLLSLVDDHIMNEDPVLKSLYNFLLKTHQNSYKFNSYNVIASFKMFIMMGETWQVKAFLDFITDDFKGALVYPNDMILIEQFYDIKVNSTGGNETVSTIKVKLNDNEVKIKGNRCMNQTECGVIEFVKTLIDEGIMMEKVMKEESSLFSLFFLTTFLNQAQSKEELLLVVEVSRHGARTPSKVLYLADDFSQNYHNRSQLTYNGKQQHFNMGKYIRQKYIDELQFLKPEYDEREVYVQTTYLNRTYLSAVFQLFGMYPDNMPNHLDYEKYGFGYEQFLSPLQRKEEPCDKNTNQTCKQHFLIHQVNSSHDYLLHLDDDNCPRFSLVKDIVKDSFQYRNITNHLLDTIGPRLRELTGWQNISNGKILISLCGFIQWSSYDKLKLKFDYTEQDLNHCLSAGDSKLFIKSYGLNETWILGAYEFLRQLDEFSYIVQETENFETKTFWSKYFKMHFHQNLKKNEKPLFPKFIHYAAHAETLSLIFEALDMHQPTRAHPGSGLFIEYIKEDEDYYVRFILKNEHEPEIIMKMDHQNEDKMNIKELQNFIENRIYFKTNDPNYIVKQCENLDFKYDEKDIYDFKKTIRDLEVHYNLQPLNGYQNKNFQSDDL